MLRNSVAPVPKNGGVPSICTLCGLLCNLEAPVTNHCDRRNRWIDTIPSRRREVVTPDLAKRLAEIHLNRGTLIWLDACDVQTTRVAIQLARQVGATIHVGQSTGSHVTKKVMASDGWLGTTLSELAARAELIVTIGDGARREAPLLAERFFQSATRTTQPYWLHISQHASDENLPPKASEFELAVAPTELIHWPRNQWFESLSELALSLIQPSDQTSAASATTIARLSARLLTAKQTVWLWDVDDLQYKTDELIVRRMLNIARALSEQIRCALLPLDLNIGRVTAEETLLWLTGCPTTATWSGQHWYRTPRCADYSLEQWSSAFSTIILVSSVASDRSLPNLPADLTIQTGPVNQAHEVQVAAVGRECAGHLFRGDRGTVLLAQATSPSELPTASELLTLLLERAVVN